MHINTQTASRFHSRNYFANLSITGESSGRETMAKEKEEEGVKEYLVVQDDGPHEAERQLLVPVDDVVRTDVDEFDLRTRDEGRREEGGKGESRAETGKWDRSGQLDLPSGT